MRMYTLILTFPSRVFYPSQGCGGKFLSHSEKGPFRSPPGNGNNTSTISNHSRESPISNLLPAVIQFFKKNKNPVIAILAVAFHWIFASGYYDERNRSVSLT